jgi:amino acid transporter
VSRPFEANRAETPRLGTFAGVFVPSTLTILGLILFQRLAYVVGAGGLGRTLLILGIATTISVVTMLSLAAIATNLRVKRGGDYYLISRTLGIHYGGALGLVLFLAQSVSVAFYCLGFAEAVAALLGASGNQGLMAVIATLAMLLLGAIAYLGVDLATRFQYVVLVVLGVALTSFFIGGAVSADDAILAASFDPPRDASERPFWVLFAIFFPAVTGFTQGVSMSGDLRDPGRSLPTGTFWAVGVSTLIYLGAAILFAAALPLETLSADYSAMRRVSAVPWLIDAGVVAATLSSAMASFLGGPRILQALAQDRVIPALSGFAAGAGPSNNPRRAVLLAGGVALTTIVLGNLNAVAAVVGMCFLLSYGLLNYATFFVGRARSPAFRPRFRWFNAWVSLAGAALCLLAGLMIHAVAALLAGVMMLALYQYLRRTAPPAQWADSRYAYHFRRVRDHLNAMREGSSHPGDWRPHVLAVCNEPLDRMRLLTFASWIDGDSGFTTAVRILTGTQDTEFEQVVQADRTLRRQIREAGLGTFSRTIAAPTLLDGLVALFHAYGLGPLRANCILLSANEQFGQAVRIGDAPPADLLAAALTQRNNLLLLDADSGSWERLAGVPAKRRRIDVWWKDDPTSRLCLLLAHLMTRSDEWAEATITLHAIASDPAGGTALRHARDMLEDVRIDAVANAVDLEGPATLVEHSRDATLVFLPLRARGGRLVGHKGFPLAAALEQLPVTALVVAGEDIDLEADGDEPAGRTLEGLVDPAVGGEGTGSA